MRQPTGSLSNDGILIIVSTRSGIVGIRLDLFRVMGFERSQESEDVAGADDDRPVRRPEVCLDGESSECIHPTVSS